MQFRERLRDLFGSARDATSTGDTSANSSPIESAPRSADVTPPPGGEAVFDDARSHDDTEKSPTSGGTNGLLIAQGQELLGPCRLCTGYWTRELTRGQKPLTCPVCKRHGPPA